jgi:hypothetical protein
MMKKNTDKSNLGYTLYKPTGVCHAFPHVDLIKQQATCIVSYKGKTYLRVIVDIKNGTVQIQVSVEDLGDLSMDRDSYIDMFKHLAKFFIENNISNPKKYFEQ